MFKQSPVKIYSVLNTFALNVFSPFLLPGTKFTVRNTHTSMGILFYSFSYPKEKRREDSQKTNSDIINI